MDKAKEAAGRATASAQHAAQQGQTKMEGYQFDRATHGLYQALGEAYYAEQRHGAGHEAVAGALGALDTHLASAPQPEADANDTGTPGSGPAGDETPGNR